MAFPEGQLCIVFCPNQRFFAADTACTDLAHPDFARTWTWERLPDGLLLARTPAGDIPMRVRMTDTAEAMVDVAHRTDLPMTRIGWLSPACMPP